MESVKGNAPAILVSQYKGTSLIKKIAKDAKKEKYQIKYKKKGNLEAVIVPRSYVPGSVKQYEKRLRKADEALNPPVLVDLVHVKGINTSLTHRKRGKITHR